MNGWILDFVANSTDMTIFVILRQNDHFETFALLFHQLF